MSSESGLSRSWAAEESGSSHRGSIPSLHEQEGRFKSPDQTLDGEDVPFSLAKAMSGFSPSKGVSAMSPSFLGSPTKTTQEQLHRYERLVQRLSDEKRRLQEQLADIRESRCAEEGSEEFAYDLVMDAIKNSQERTKELRQVGESLEEIAASLE